MFENPGSTIKKIAKICFYLSLAAGILLFVYGVTMYAEDKDYIQYSTAYGYPSLVAAATNALRGRSLMIWSIPSALASMLSDYILYGFGELVEKSTSTNKIIAEIEKKVTLSPEALEKQELQNALKF